MRKSIFRFFIIFTVFALLFLINITGCKEEPAVIEEIEEVAEEEAVPAEALRIGLSVPNSGFPWMASFVEQFELLCTERGWEGTALSADGDLSIQLGQIEDFVSKGVDYLIISPYDPKATTPGMKKAFEAGIAVIVVANPPDEEAFQYLAAIRVPSDEEMGRGSAELMVEALNGTGTVVVVDGEPGVPCHIIRWAAINKVWESAGIELLESQPAYWDSTKAVSVTQDLLTRYPDVDGVFSFDGAMTPGVIQVVKEVGFSGPVVGLGGTKTEKDAIINGDLYGTTSMSPKQNCDAAIEAIEKLEAGEKITLMEIISTPKITIDNVDDCPGDW